MSVIVPTSTTSSPTTSSGIAISTAQQQTQPSGSSENERTSVGAEADISSTITCTKRGCNRCQNCSGYTAAAHDWRSTCTGCRCPRSVHDVSIGGTCCGFDRVGFDPPASSATTTTTSSTTSSPSGCSRRAMAEEMGYAWIPPGIPHARVDEWMRTLPDQKVPKLGSSGETYRETQLLHQLPKQDLSLKHCQHVAAKDMSSYQDFICARNDIALDVGHALVVPAQKAAAVDKTNKEEPEPAGSCRKCKKDMFAADLAVVAPRFGLKTYWHPACFTCTGCDEFLVDLTYCVHNEQLYCERHYAENLKPRCGACDELIFDGQYTKALGKDFHADHFVCVSCNKSLTGNRYVLTDDHPCCVPCYEQTFTHSCRVCERRIGLDSKDMSYKDLHWHEDCFKCRRCKTSLVEKPFAARNALIFCAACYDAEFATRCDACGDTFRPGMKKMEYKTRKWHDKCFQCVVCKTQVGSKPFIIPNDTDVYCVGCFEEKFATKCTKCKKIMTTGGVTFKNEAWHRECFVCTNCQTMLAGQKFASRQDKPYCANCFGELFAKRCTACSKPITGAGGTRFISFEGRHWHSQCFMCANCQVSMAGKGFITDGDEIICPDCAKDKLLATATGVQAN